MKCNNAETLSSNISLLFVIKGLHIKVVYD